MFEKLKQLVSTFKMPTLNTVTVNSNMVTRKYPISKFNDLYNSTMVDIVIIPLEDKESDYQPVMKLTCPESLIENIVIEQNKDLKISHKVNDFVINMTNQKLTLEVPARYIKNIYNSSMGDIDISSGASVTESINNTGSGEIKVNNFIGTKITNKSLGNILIDVVTNDYLYIESKGSGNITIEDGGINNLDCNLHSLGDITISANITDAKISSSGSGDIKIDNIKNAANINLTSLGSINLDGKFYENLTINTSGSGDIEINDIDTELLKLNLKSLGNIKINQGRASDTSITSSGSGDIKASEVTFINSDIEMKSLGNVSFQPVNTLIAKISGSGDLKLQGNRILESARVEIKSLGQVKTKDVQAKDLTVIGKEENCQIRKNFDFVTLQKPKMK